MDPFKPTLTIQALTKPLNLEAYKKGAIEEIKKFSPYIVDEEQATTLGNQSAYKIIYSGYEGKNDLKIMQIFTLKGDDRAYIITYTAEKDEYDNNFLRDVEVMINSFEFLGS